jgi:hypothetical protein
MNLLFDDVDIFEDDFDILDLLIFTIWMNLHSIEDFD